MSAKTGKQCQFGQDMAYLTTVYSLEKFPYKFHGIRGIGRACYIRATVTATLHIGTHECKNRQTVSVWSRYDISYHNLQS